MLKQQEGKMLYEISMFWDSKGRGTSATAQSADATHWVSVSAVASAKTTIFVETAEHAQRLADLINELTGATQQATAAAA